MLKFEIRQNSHKWKNDDVRKEGKIVVKKALQAKDLSTDLVSNFAEPPQGGEIGLLSHRPKGGRRKRKKNSVL